MFYGVFQSCNVAVMVGVTVVVGLATMVGASEDANRARQVQTSITPHPPPK